MNKKNSDKIQNEKSFKKLYCTFICKMRRLDSCENNRQKDETKSSVF